MSWLTCYLLLCTGLFQLQRDMTCEGYQNVDSAVKLRDVVMLRCAYPQRSRMTQISWLKHVDGVKHQIAVYNPNLGEHIFFPYNQSLTFISSSTSGDIMLNATAAGEGIYQCSMNTFPDGILLKQFAIMNPAKFSKIRAADTRVQFVPGNNVTLFCGHSNRNNDAQVTWKRVTEEEINMIVNIIHSQIIIGYDYRGRIQFNYLPFDNISLTIQNMTTNDVGMYHCHVATSKGNWTKVFDVGEEGEQSDVTSSRMHDTIQVLTEGQNYPAKAVTDLTIFLIIGAVALGTLVLVTSVVSIICVRRRKKQKRIKKQLKKSTTERNHQRRANQNSYSVSDVYDRANSRMTEYQDEAIYANL